ncbi:helix-turn-helix transcriptional regulator [Mannheimia indoligenes]|uniref:helix-turn-helix transcriptional regulator n=1 Tax=Mannheimia indoligenes TaxID=3103145 RepID=UPI002FE58E35
MKKNDVLAQRISLILARLNQGERIDINQIVDEFDISLRTLQRDLNERLAFLAWEEFGPRYYKINRSKLGILDEQDIQRFAIFASVSDLFPKIDQTFYQEKLTESVQVKGFQYEDIRHLDKEFKLIQRAIETHQFIDFSYIKSGQIQAKFYKIAPHSLINKNGIWYLIGTDNDKQKTFCFTQMKMLKVLDETFEPNQQLLEEIKTNDSISFGNQISEVLIKVASDVASYFLRRNLLPNQELVHKSENNELILSCKNIHEFEIVPLVQYWIPHLTIISPVGLQGKLTEKLTQYLAAI